MITIVQPLIVNIAIIFSLTFIANMIVPFNLKQQYSFRDRMFFGIMGSLTAVLCLVYPIETLGDTVFDLRTVPLIVVTLYAGFTPGLLTAGVIVIGRLMIGGPYAWIGVIVTLAAFIIALIFKKTFLLNTQRWKGSILVGITFFIVYLLILLVTLEFLDLSFYVAYFLPYYTAYFLVFYLINHLISINKRLEETIYLDKLSVLGQMAASIAHEVRNPLTTVRGLIQLIGAETRDPKLQQYTPLILDELDRTNNIISDYLSMVKPQSRNIELIELEKILEETAALVGPLAAYHNVKIHVEYKDKHLIRGDKQQLKQSFLNIIKNAIEAIENGGEIYVKTQINSKRDTVEVNVSDTGVGMTNKQLENIGLPFYTTKTKGTGLGTMITKNLIGKNGGKIEYQSELEEGTIVTVLFPLA
jgi:two-component system sporulation sensor kinase B